MSEAKPVCIVCLRAECRDLAHASVHAQTLMLTDAMSIAAVLRRLEPTALEVCGLKIRLVVDPTMPPGEAKLICGPRPEQQVRVTSLADQELDP